jgi:type III restriction enzyme
MGKTLQQVLIEELGKRAIEGTQVPSNIADNLNPIFPLRPYQERGFKFFINYWDEKFDGKPRINHQLLMHMATGSGKTMMMAGMMLHLYAQGYRNFLFFVNSSNIIDKTKSNFLDKNSSKYLFANSISVGPHRVEIREVTNFQTSDPDAINIAFTTIQGLHSSLNAPRENGLSYEDFEDTSIVLISDEAHHINADTKKGAALDQDELFEIVSWEGTVERIFRACPSNVLLEFTATMDLSDEHLREKYNPKLLFDYPLKDFRKDGYSKEVKVLQADLSQMDRALQAVLLSQYRRKVFEKFGLLIKPVILFKSKTIKESESFLKAFSSTLKKLDSSQIATIASRSNDEAIARMFGYFTENKIDFENLATELHEDFSEEKLISVNSKDESIAKQIAVNSLEINEYRAVFAVDKLNEGWDVLNLFDIVRLYDTRDSKAGKVGKTTMSEAQLIGRGARYCPFQISKNQPRYGRKYDTDLANELRICEELYYHSAYNPKYIQELNTALQEIGLKAKETKTRKVQLKATFKNTNLFKAGHIFLNEQVPYDRAEIDGLDSSLIKKIHNVKINTGFSKSTVAFDTLNPDRGFASSTHTYLLSEFDRSVIRTALQRLSFYEFSNLKRFLPQLESIHQFITSKRYLGQLKIEVTGRKEEIENLTPDQKLDATLQLLEEISSIIASNKIEFKGTKEFKPKMMNAVFTDKTLNFMIDDGGDKEFGRSMSDASETSYHLDLATKEWFVFDDCFGTSEEKLLIKYIDKRYAELVEIYSGVYLIRNEKHFKLYAFEDGRALEPDFVLYLIGKDKAETMHYQVFIEPKGKHLLKTDEWKEDFLKSIKSEFSIEQLFSNKKYVVWGMPFYNSVERLNEFDSEFDNFIV